MGDLKTFCKRNNLSFEKLDELCYKMGASKKDILIVDGLQYPDGNNSSLYLNYPPMFIKSLNKEIKANQNIYMPKYMIFFHGTASYLKDTILENGLLPTSDTRRRSYQSTNGYVYLANTYGRAQTFGNLGNGDKICVFAVMVKTTDIKADLDQLRNQQMVRPDEVIKQTLGDSMFYGGGVRVKGKIEPYQLVLL